MLIITTSLAFVLFFTEEPLDPLCVLGLNDANRCKDTKVEPTCKYENVWKSVRKYLGESSQVQKVQKVQLWKEYILCCNGEFGIRHRDTNSVRLVPERVKQLSTGCNIISKWDDIYCYTMPCIIRMQYHIRMNIAIYSNIF